MKTLKILFANNIPDNNIVELLKPLADEVKVLDINRLEEEPSLIVFTGGEDVHPEYYGENTGKYTGGNKVRDKKESDTFHRFNYNVPKLGICRGAQFTTVMCGGKLVQHVSGHTQEHTIEDKDGNVLKVTSTHHQMMYPFNMRPENYELIAWSQYYKSDTYLDGNNKEIKKPTDFLEPEIVFYPNYKTLSIQGHPEFNHASEEFKEYTLNLIQQYLFTEKTEVRKPFYQPKPQMNQGFREQFLEDTIVPGQLKLRRTGISLETMKAYEETLKKSIEAIKFGDSIVYGSGSGLGIVDKEASKPEDSSTPFWKQIKRK